MHDKGAAVGLGSVNARVAAGDSTSEVFHVMPFTSSRICRYPVVAASPAGMATVVGFRADTMNTAVTGQTSFKQSLGSESALDSIVMVTQTESL